jgi:uracil phosphoribosyltransferase
MDNLTVIDHPLLKRELTRLRRTDTPHGNFRRALQEVASMLGYEALRDMRVGERSINTPLEQATGHVLDEEVIVVPILRAGLGMVEGLVQFVPEARVGHLGMQRDERTKEPVDYYSNIPGGLPEARVFVVDPMLATGGSASRAVERLKERGAERLTFVCVVAAPEGVEALRNEHPDVPVITAALDRELDDDAFIRPGLGDAGDRTFGT